MTYLSLCLGDVGDAALDGDDTLRVEAADVADGTDGYLSVGVLQCSGKTGAN